MAGITSELFGKTQDGRDVTRFTLTNSNGVCVKILDYGGVITNILVPDKNGKIDDVTLGLDNMADYQSSSPYFGAICGRVANRIAGGEFTLEGHDYKLFLNSGPNSGHGGKQGFDKKIWTAEVKHNELVLTLVSPDGEENYPGKLTAIVTYSLDNDDCLKLDYRASTDKTTIVNLTNHAYFNLAGHECNYLDDHVITVPRGKSYLPINEKIIPTGEVVDVSGTEFDLLTPVRLGDRFSSVREGKGFDTNFCLDGDGSLQLAARVEHPPTGRYIECSTTEPGIQVYTGCNLKNFTGKAGANYNTYGAFCLEAQHYPDSIHHPHFPSTVLKPGDIYSQTTVYKFGIV